MTQHDRRSTVSRATVARSNSAQGAERKAVSKPGSRRRVLRRGFARRDGSGHLDPHYEATLLAMSGRSQNNTSDRAFIEASRSDDALAEQLAEGFVETATTGQYE